MSQRRTTIVWYTIVVRESPTTSFRALHHLQVAKGSVSGRLPAKRTQMTSQLSRPTEAVDAAFTAACVGTEPADDADWGLGASADALPSSSLPLLTAQSMGVLPPHSLVTYRGMVRSHPQRSTRPQPRLLQRSSAT
jgi:hypothetical protein